MEKTRHQNDLVNGSVLNVRITFAVPFILASSVPSIACLVYYRLCFSGDKPDMIGLIDRQNT